MENAHDSVNQQFLDLQGDHVMIPVPLGLWTVRRTFRMMFEDEKFLRCLRRIIGALPCNDESKKDIHQEALIHLRELEHRKPKQNLSWYLQACKFRAQHVLSRGRSIDSPKRAGKRVPLPEDPDLADELLNPVQDRNGLFFSSVSANDIERLLQTRLSRTERRILRLLRDGYSLREIGAKLGVSHPTVLQYRKKIARFAVQLGLHAYAEKRKD